MNLEAIRKTRFGNSTAKALFVYLAGRADDATGLCWPTMSKIAEETELALRQVQRLLQVFRSLGLVASAGKHENGAPMLRVNFALLGTDFSESFGAAYAKLQGEKAVVQSVCETFPMTKNVCETQENVCETLQSVCETFPPHPLIGVSTNEEPLKNQGLANAPDTPVKPKLLTIPQESDEDVAERIWRSWRRACVTEDSSPGLKPPGIQNIRAAIVDLRSQKAVNPSQELVERVERWLQARHKRRERGWVASLPHASTWFGKRSRGYMDDDALPPPARPDEYVTLPTGERVLTSSLQQQGWTTVEVA